MKLLAVTFAQAAAFVAAHHRHNKPPVSHKFSVGLEGDATHACVHCWGVRQWPPRLIGVAVVGRPVARALDDVVTVEVTRTCVVTGQRNANSMLYGACARAAKALGHTRIITYTQHGETGASLRGAGWKLVAELPARGNWADSSVTRPRSVDGTQGGVPRMRWELDLASRGSSR